MKKTLHFALLLAGAVSFATTASADYLDGLAATVRGDFKTACQEFSSLADQGDAKAQVKLAELHAKGQCGPQSDTEAAKWLTKAAELGNAEAQLYLGAMYQKGKGVPQSDADALKWLRKAAEQGDATGQSMLGLMLYEGKGVQSDEEAVKWYRLAAEQGNRFGQRLLGGMYANGRGVAQDYLEAYKWLTLAFEKGEVEAGGERSRFQGKMKPEQIAEAKRLAAEWRPVKATKKKS